MEPIQTSFALFDEKRAYIKGRLVHEVYHNPENLYTVSKIRIIETTENIEDRQITVVGYYPSLFEGEVYTFWGKMTHHPRFGRQYQVDHLRKDIPRGKEGLIHYLASDLFPGVGPKTASRIVDILGENAIQLILENPEVLKQVPKLQEKTRQTLYERLLEHQGLEQIMVKLSEFGIGLALSVQIYREYRERALDVLQDNPYQLIEDIKGIGFRRADAIARAMGIERDSPLRIRAACIYFLWEQAEQNGHVFFPLPDFVREVNERLNAESGEDRPDGQLDEAGEARCVQIDEEMIAGQLIELGEEGKLIIEEERIYLPSLFFAEKGFARKVKELLQTSREELDRREFYAALGSLEERLGIAYAPSQREAIEKALQSPIMILTGGPGTGKTTVIKGICEIYADLHGMSLDPKEYAHKGEPFPVILVAPTGRAAKRMQEATGIPAVTIHRLLGWQGGQTFEHTEDNPISGRLLIVDETSMMDQWLANQLFRTLPAGMKVVLVGDEDQLPSVGPGQVLKDLLESGRVPVVELKDIFRQSSGSSIITLAHEIKQGRLPEHLSDPQADRRFFAADSAGIVEVVRQVCSAAMRKGYTPKDIQVLAPMYRGEAGIDALNKALQEEFNPLKENKRELRFKEQTFRVGDKVLQLVNNPEEGVYNGDIGEVSAIVFSRESVDKQDQLVVSFDGTEVTYSRSDFQQITLAYCCSVHKAQGSEFPIVVLPVVRSYFRMLRRNLIYTAITRSKEYLILCGEEQALEYAVRRHDVAERHTSLKDTLLEWLPGLESNPSHD